MRKPDFENNLLKILQKGKPQRATLFELFLNNEYYERIAGHGWDRETELSRMKMVVDAMAASGYDYAPSYGSRLQFPSKARRSEKTKSLNGQASIWDWDSFEKYAWPDPDNYDYSVPEKLRDYLPEGMKLCIEGPCGVIENVINIVGYDNLCFMLYDEPELAEAIFNKVGSILVRYYENSTEADTVGFVCANDDWGFNTQTFLSVADMRKYVFPWHKKIVEVAHKRGLPCILHSCGRYDEVIDDIIYDIKFDGRHSYEDNIIPVEEAYETLQGKIAVMGGIDMSFITTAAPEEIYARSRAMLERSADRGGYVLGSGNSIPPYVPFENFLALNRAALEFDE